jgi:O-acetyl-ADP-ribose deacetylase (regulator of RNase III)
MSIRYEHGDFLAAPVEAVVNTVNTRGVMGKGIALQVKQRWPEVDRAYRAASKHGDVTLGCMHVVERGGFGEGPRFVVNFPTKDHWRSRSKLSDIEAGLVDLRATIEKLGIRSIAIPPLGCGNGGLEWADVRPLIETALDDLDEVDVLVYPPEGAPAAERMVAGTPKPRMTPTLAGLVRLLDGYWADVLGITDIEVQKLAYFLGVRRPVLQLHFTRGPYGPYCEDLQFVLVRAEGHFLRGYGDRSRRPWEPGPLEVLPGAVDVANQLVRTEPAFDEDLQAVAELLDGFEGAWGLELLSTVHWVATEPAGATDPSSARKRIGTWSARKNRLFPEPDVEEAWNRLASRGWLDAPVEAPTLFES